MNVPAGTPAPSPTRPGGDRRLRGPDLSGAVGGADVVRTDVSLTKLATRRRRARAGRRRHLHAARRATTARARRDERPDHRRHPAGHDVRHRQHQPPGRRFAGGVYSAAAERGRVDAASFGPGASATLSFQVRINAGHRRRARVVPNRGIYESTQTPTFSRTRRRRRWSGPLLGRDQDHRRRRPLRSPPAGDSSPSRSRCATRGPARPRACGSATPSPLSNATYVAGTMQSSVNGAAFASLTDAADARRRDAVGHHGRAASSRASPRAPTCASASRRGSTPARAAWS